MARAPTSPKSPSSPVKDAVQSEFVSLIKELWKDLKKFVLEKAVLHLKKAMYTAHKRFNGATVAVIGPPASGKTTLLKVLQNPAIPSDALRIYSKTEVEPHEGMAVDFKLSVDTDEQIRFRFKIKKNSDVGGEQYIRDQHWAGAIKDAAVIIYVLDATRLLSEDNSTYKGHVLADFDWLLEHTQSFREDFAIVIAVNKIDLLCERGNYQEFLEANVQHLDELKQTISKRWPAHLVPHLKGGIFLSLLDQGLRAFTLNGLISCFVGDDLMELYRHKESE